LSAFLDNTPTAVTFHALAKGMDFSHLGDVSFVAHIPETFLHAICLSSVLFGSLTYIGNGPNFMVKAIAESRNIKMPDFFAYMYKFSFIVLLPLFILVAIIFGI
jgi:Na+/H+ antiporter NhaD/arsenite permease-like protein